MAVASPPMRVLYLIDSLGVGGKERQMVQLLVGLSKTSQVETSLLCMDQESFYMPDLASINVPLKLLIRRVRWDVTVFYRLYRIVKTFEPDIIHVNSMMPAFYAFPVAKLLGIPLINGSIRNAFSSGGVRWTLEKLLLQLSEFRVANSEAGLLSRRFIKDSKRNFVIYNGFDWSRVVKAEAQAATPELIDVSNKKLVGMVAEFSELKDYKTYILAAERVLRNRQDVVFLSVGDGPTLHSFKNVPVAGNSLLRFLGKRTDIENIVSKLNIGVLATYTEGISNSIMEYMAFGKPVVVTDGGGSREIVVDGETGFLVPPKDPDCLTNRIEYLLDHPDVANKMGNAGRDRLKKVFSLERLVEETVNLYEISLATKKDKGLRSFRPGDHSDRVRSWRRRPSADHKSNSRAFPSS